MMPDIRGAIAGVWRQRADGAGGGDLVPIWVQALGIVGLAVLLALLGQAVVRRRVRHEALVAHTDVAGFVYAALAVIYGVILAQVVIAAWEGFEEGRRSAVAEASAWLDLFRLAEGWPEPERALIETALVAYGREVVDGEWPAMARGEEPDPAAVARMRDLWGAYEGLGSGAPELAAGVLFAASIDELDELDDARVARLLASRSELPGIMWGVLIAGGVLTVAFAYLFGVENAVAQGVMVSALAGLIALLLFLILALGTPFGGSARIGPEAFERVLALAAEEAG